MGQKLIKGIFAKDHASYKKGDSGKFAESTLRALQAHGILEKSKSKKKVEKEEVKEEPKGKAEAILSKPKTDEKKD